jgi:predicted nucleotidyltransferase
MKVDTTALPFDTERLIAICRQHGVIMVGLFGSYARGDQHPASDIDLLVRFRQPVSLLDMIALEQELADALKQPIDLVTEAALHPALKPAILHDLRVLYAVT